MFWVQGGALSQEEGDRSLSECIELEVMETVPQQEHNKYSHYAYLITLERLRGVSWWLMQARDVEAWYRSCIVC